MKLITVLLLLLTSVGFSQAIQVEVNGNIFNTNQDSVMVSQFYGSHYVDYLKGKLDKKGDFGLLEVGTGWSFAATQQRFADNTWTFDVRWSW